MWLNIFYIFRSWLSNKMILWLSNLFIIQTGSTCKSVREGGRYVSKTDSHWIAIKTIVSKKTTHLKTYLQVNSPVVFTIR